MDAVKPVVNSSGWICMPTPATNELKLMVTGTASPLVQRINSLLAKLPDHSPLGPSVRTVKPSAPPVKVTVFERAVAAENPLDWVVPSNPMVLIRSESDPLKPARAVIKATLANELWTATAAINSETLRQTFIISSGTTMVSKNY